MGRKKKKIFQEAVLHVLKTSAAGNALFPNPVAELLLHETNICKSLTKTLDPVRKLVKASSL